MSKTGEIILTTEETGQLWNACVWDPSTGTALMTYKGANAAGPHAACFLGKDYLLLSDKTKPVLNAWPVNSPHPVKSVKLDCTGKVNAMAVTPNGFFCVTAVGKKLIVWQIASGVQLTVLERHFQSVTCVKFTRDGSHFISGGEDGQALVWALAYVVSRYSGEIFPEQTEPRFSFSDHGLPIQDIFVGFGGIRSRLVTVSLDKSCRLYDLSCGQLLATFVLSYSLSAVTMNAVETMVFVGAINGKIFQLDLCSLPRIREHHVTDRKKGKVFVGHSKVVTCLSVSQDGTILLSGSHDRQVILWDISTRENIRTIEHNGTITNAFFAMAPKQMFYRDFEPVLVLCSFKKTSNEKEGLIIRVRTTEDQWDKLYPIQDPGAVGGIEIKDEDRSQLQEEVDATEIMDDAEVKEKLVEATQKNAELYKFTMEKIFNTFNICEEKRTNEDKKMEAEGKSSDSGDSKFRRKKKAQQKHKDTGKKSKKFLPSPK